MLLHNGSYVCPNCFENFSQDQLACPSCGYAGNEGGLVPDALPAGTILYGKYIVGRVLGKGGFGITYLSYHLTECQKVAVKEYFPDTLAYRSTGETVVSTYPGERENAYRIGAEKFYEEAKTVSRFNGHPGIVQVAEFFYENNTAYFAMEYVKGSDLKAYIDAHGRLSEQQTLQFLLPTMDALTAVHAVGVLHRDVSPDNIFLCENGAVKLLDFGSARQVLGEQSKSLSVVLKHGFAPIEQYQTRGKQGPWTDVYALGATMYYCLTGNIPEPAMDRIEEDGLTPPSGLGIVLSPRFEAALLRALSVKAAARFQTVTELRNALSPAGFPPTEKMDEARLKTKYVPQKEEKTPANERVRPSKTPRRKKRGVAIWLSVLVVSLFAVWLALGSDLLPTGAAQSPEPSVTHKGDDDVSGVETPEPSPEPEDTPPPTPTPTATPQSTPTLAPTPTPVWSAYTGPSFLSVSTTSIMLSLNQSIVVEVEAIYEPPEYTFATRHDPAYAKLEHVVGTDGLATGIRITALQAGTFVIHASIDQNGTPVISRDIEVTITP